ncbi:hypothetical protein BLNAU_8407 [Blattamonas nauphoetae]|uniref:Uncharacterized protein n=1 Tax=Blattamonas nauphoetae TaxID=2049346 RepID=A0ABQ9XYK0_9EUKA|nr:hypothetical protein BLNAU_8407 [Blattamonas nauphoetae]
MPNSKTTSQLIDDSALPLNEMEKGKKDEECGEPILFRETARLPSHTSLCLSPKRHSKPGVPQLITTLNPQSLDYAETADVHVTLMNVVRLSLWLAALLGLEDLGILNHNEQQAVRETVFTQVLTPLEKYISHLCMNRFSIVDGDQSEFFLALLATLLEICPYYQATMYFVLNMPVFVAVPSCLTFFNNDRSIWAFLNDMNNAQRKWNRKMGVERQMWKTVHRTLRMEGLEDVIEAKLRNDRKEYYGGWIVANLIEWIDFLGMNLSRSG